MEHKITVSIEKEKCCDIEIIKKAVDEVVDEVTKFDRMKFRKSFDAYKFKCICDCCRQEFVCDLPTRFCEKCNITESAKLPKLFTYRKDDRNEHE